MPDPEAAVMDTPAESQTQPANETVDSTPAQTADTAPVKLVLGKWKTEEDALKHIEEQNKLYGRQAEELGRLRSEVERAREQASLKDVLTKLADSSNRPANEPPALDIDTFTQQLGDEWVDGKTASKKLLGVANSWVAQAEAKHKAELEAMRKEVEAKISEMRETVDRSSADYQQNKEAVDALVAEGLSISKAIKVVRKLAKSESSSSGQAARTPPPVSVVPTRTIANDNKPQPAHLFGEQDLDILRLDFPELDDKQLRAKAAEMNARRQARVNAGEPLVERISKPLPGRRM